MHYSYIVSVIKRYVSNSFEIEELTNDVFLQIFQKINNYNSKYPIKSWIKRITVNKCIDKYRKEINSLRIISLNQDIEEEQIFDPFWHLDDFENISDALLQIPEKYRLIFNLYVFEDYTHKEIAKKLNIPIGTSKSAVSRAKKILRKYYELKKNKHALQAKSV